MQPNSTFLRIISTILLCALLLTGCLGTESTVPTPPNEHLTTCHPGTTSANTETEVTTVHEHTFGDATCTLAKTCATCNVTEGDPLGHNWSQATCTTPAVCMTCGAMNGDANGHNWKPATCSTPLTCDTCGETDGTPIDHNWQNATCTAAATCIVCGKTKGNPIEHKWKSATCTAAKTCKVCGKTKGSPASHKYSKGTCSNCGGKDPNYKATTSSMVWIPTNGGKKYHRRSSCSNMKNPEQVTLSSAKQLGFTACKRCYG